MAKRLHSLREVRGVAEFALRDGLELQLLIQGAGRFHVEHRFDALEGLSGTGGQAPRDGFGLRLQGIILDAGSK